MVVHEVVIHEVIEVEKNVVEEKKSQFIRFSVPDIKKIQNADKIREVVDIEKSCILRVKGLN